MSGPVLIMAGGTGGHVYPGLAVARELLERGVEVVWMGTRAGIEARVVPAAGIPVEWVPVAGVRGKGWRRRLAAPFMVARAVWHALGVMRRLRPRAVLGMGGFVAGPGGVAAWLARRPLCIHEQNAVAGLTNRLLARIARRVACAFPAAFPGRRVVVTGNPVREEIAALPAPAERWAGRRGPLRLLVLGGSLGAQALNLTVPAALGRLPAGGRPLVRHQTGRGKLEETRAAYAEAGVEGELEEFLEEMAEAYGWADLVVCRAGALTISELAAAGVGALLVPYPHAVDDHQTRNGAWLVEAGAARMIDQRELDAERLAAELAALDRPALLAMAEAARAVARPNAAAELAEICLEEGRG
ncbi:MAG TPA: undecaprenyldiphospho-muramoylpentapeptide beta-N-acetylglucosaminyltransferase [Thiotrichales bacterium]|nr:undecaprenyldiphospho-muramoylpentapeptide beta-N-acetylglucosaminyltransferase [Thiotrichales bacterium]